MKVITEVREREYDSGDTHFLWVYDKEGGRLRGASAHPSEDAAFTRLREMLEQGQCRGGLVLAYCGGSTAAEAIRNFFTHRGDPASTIRR